jgi:hypothetical protein
MRHLRSLAFVAIAVLAPASAPAFLLHYALEGPGGEFALDIDETPMWTLTVDGGKTVYAGVALDSAKFSGELDISFSDSVNVTRNDQPVEATLKGKLKNGCDADGKGSVTLKDATNGVSFTVESEGAGAQTCSGNL